MSKIATMYDTKGDDQMLRKDIKALKDAVNRMQTSSSGWITFTNLTEVKTLDANATSTAELADTLGTLINALKAAGILGG
jgi:hypothetical protein